MGRAKVFGERWQVTSPLDEGGQSWVYHVDDLRGESTFPTVLKRLKNQDRIGRLANEIEAYRKLDHPGIPPLVDHFLEAPAYFVTKYFPGATLEEVGKRPPLVALEIFEKLCEVVTYAHSQGVVHRDLKPANVIVTEEGNIVVVDFGLCYFVDDEERLTQSMEQVGSRQYMAPEAEAGRADHVTPASDVYQLGKILYFLVTGQPPVREDVTGEDDAAAIEDDPQLAYMTERIISRSVVRDTDQRSSVSELRDAALQVHELIAEHYYPGIEGSKCRFCGEGTYAKRGQNVTVRLRGAVYEAGQPVDLYVCATCKNVQWFLRGNSSALATDS